MKATVQNAEPIFEVQMVPQRVKVGETEKTYTLVLNEVEAAFITTLVGSFSLIGDSRNTTRGIANRIFHALNDAGAETVFGEFGGESLECVLSESEFAERVARAIEAKDSFATC